VKARESESKDENIGLGRPGSVDEYHNYNYKNKIRYRYNTQSVGIKLKRK